MATVDEIKAARFERPAAIPVRVHVNPACWNRYPEQAVTDLLASHPRLFPGYCPGQPRETLAPRFRAGAPYTDSWGCVFQTAEDGLAGSPIRHPLANWPAFDHYTPPDPNGCDGWDRIDWTAIAERIGRERAEGRPPSGGLRHGHTFMTLMFLRGYENLVFDMADGRPELDRLIAMVEAFNRALVDRFLALDVAWMDYPEDLGMQRGPMLSPDMFRRYIKPVYRRLMQPARDAGAVVHMHCDGDVRDLADDLIECGVQVLNIQDLVNGIDWLAANLKGRIAIDLDIDRQNIVRAGSPRDIAKHVRHCVDALNAPEGGLMLTWGWYPGIPLENAQAVMDALEVAGQ